MTPIPPFGPPEILARPIVARIPASACATAFQFYRRLREELAPAAAGLLESSDPAGGAATRSILAVRCPLRLELRGNVAEVTPLETGAMPWIQALGRRLPGARIRAGRLRLEFRPRGRDSMLDDSERLTQPSVLDAVRAVAGLVGDAEPTPLAPGLFGAFGYEIVDRFEDLPGRRPDPNGDPDATFLLATDQVLYDHVAGEVSVITRCLDGEDFVSAHRRHSRYLVLLDPKSGGRFLAEQSPPASAPVPGAWVTDLGREAFLEGVETVRREISAGEVFQTVLSRGFSVPSPARSLDVFRELRQTNPSPYMFHLDMASGSLLGASPETYLKVEDGEVEIRPIAGTVPRGDDPETDRRLALQLLLDPKEQAEHAMLLDLARNDVARVSSPGTMRVVQQFEIESFSHVQHLVSRVRGKLRPGLDALHAYRAVANMGTLTGAPKLRATALIRELEPRGRGFYGGAAGYLLQDGRFDSCIVIRSLRHRNGVYSTRAGAGIVHDSDPEREFAETKHKAQACLDAVTRAAATLAGSPAERAS